MHRSRQCHRHHLLTRCIPLIGNYDQGLEREGRRQLIPIKETAAKEFLGPRRSRAMYQLIFSIQVTLKNSILYKHWTNETPKQTNPPKVLLLFLVSRKDRQVAHRKLCIIYYKLVLLCFIFLFRRQVSVSQAKDFSKCAGYINSLKWRKCETNQLLLGKICGLKGKMSWKKLLSSCSAVYPPVLHNSLVNSLFEFRIRLKWPKNSPKQTIISFLWFVIQEKINESCDTVIHFCWNKEIQSDALP